MIESLYRRFVAVTITASIVVLSPGLAAYAAAAEIEGPAGKGVTSLPALNTSLAQPLAIPGAQTGVEIPNLNVPGASVEIPVLPSPAALTPAATLDAPRSLEQALPGTPQAAAQRLTELSAAIAPQIEAASRADNADPRGAGETIERLVEGESVVPAAGTVESVVAESRRTGSDILPAAELPNPYGLYQHAYPAAVAKAAELGKSPAQVHFYEASASVPGTDGASWKFAFYLTDKETTPEALAKAKPSVGDIVYVDFKKADLGSAPGGLTVSDDPHVDSYLRQYLAGQARFAVPHSYAPSYELPRVSVYKGAPLAEDWVPFTAEPLYLKKGSEGSAQGALEAARRQGMKGGVSVSFKMREQPVSGDKDYWYSFHDNAGNVFLANGRSGEERFKKAVPAAKPETPSARLARFTGRGSLTGLAAGVLAAGAIWHGATHLDTMSDLGFKVSLIAMLWTPLAMLLSAVGLTKLGGKIGAWLSGVKAPKAAPAAPPTAPALAPKIEKPAAVSIPAQAAAPRKYPAEGAHERSSRVAGEWIGGGLTLASVALAYHFSAALVSAFGVGAILATSFLPFLGLAFVLGGAAIGGSLGRRKDAGKPAIGAGAGVLGRGLLGGLATIGASWVLGALTGGNPLLYLAMLSIPQVVAGTAGLVTALILHRKLDFGQDKWARLGGATLTSGLFSGGSLLAAAGYFLFSVVGTVKDAPNRKIEPLHDGVAPLYAEAYAAAFKAAAAKGYKPEQVAFSEAQASSPADAKRGWSFEFIARKTAKAAKGEVIRATIYPQQDGAWRASAYAYGEADVPKGATIRKLAPTSFKLGSKVSLGSSLARAAQALGKPEGELGLSVRLVKEQGSGDKDLWYVFDNEDGARWGANARTGEERAFENGVARDRVVAAAKSAASYKGRPWSQTEYNMEQSMIESSLRKDGAGPAQIRLFYQLCAEAPIRGGSFNPWSGD